MLPYYSSQSESAAFDIASEHLAALTNSSSAEVEAIRGFIAFRQWRWLEAEQYFQLSLAKNSDIATTHVWYSQFLSAVGQLDTAMSHAQTAYELDSVSAVINDRLATTYLWVGQDKESRLQFTAGANLGFASYLNPSYLILLLRSDGFEALRFSLHSLHPDGNLEPLIENIQNLKDLAARPGIIKIIEQSIQVGALMPRLEFGMWVVLEQWAHAAETIEKFSAVSENSP